MKLLGEPLPYPAKRKAHLVLAERVGVVDEWQTILTKPDCQRGPESMT